MPRKSETIRQKISKSDIPVIQDDPTEDLPSIENLLQFVELVEISWLKPNPRNPKKHPPEQIEEIIISLRERGWTAPVLAGDDGDIIVGHGRHMAAKSIYARGDTIKTPSGGILPMGKVPAIIARGWTEAQKRAYRIADNAIAEHGSWDANLLNFELSALDESGFDMSLTGFDLDRDAEQAKDKGPQVREVIETSDMKARFWVSLRGPLEDQARVLDAVKKALGEPGEIEIDVGVMV